MKDYVDANERLNESPNRFEFLDDVLWRLAWLGMCVYFLIILTR